MHVALSGFAEATPRRQRRRDDSCVRAFEAFIDDPAFPCVGAKSARARGRLRYLRAGDIGQDRDDGHITRALQAFAAQAACDEVFVSMAVLFPDSPALEEEAFEQALWQRLTALHAIDSQTCAWDPSVSADPASPHFSMSIGGRAFFVIGLHPGASRRARRFAWPVLVFNLHSQFEQLRADGRYEKLRGAIIGRDVALDGDANPMLAVHGAATEARQYSGRQVDAQWSCPFHAVRGPRQ